MLRLRTLGTLALDGVPHANDRSALQPRRLAILAAIGSESDGITRDKLLGLFWPDASEERARHALNQALYALRRALAVDDIFVGTQRLRLNSCYITVDRRDFECAVAAGDHEGAVRLYAGAYLDGVFVDDAPDFERWVESERGRLARSYIAELYALTSSAVDRSDASVSTWWRMLTEVDPLDSRATLGLMRALAAAGDYVGAIREAQEHEERMRAELGIAPVQDVPDLARSLRERFEARAEASVVAPFASDVLTHATPTSPSAMTARRKRTRALTVAAALTMVFAATFAKVSGGIAPAGSGDVVTVPDSNLVAVLPIRVFGDSAPGMGVGLADLLRGALDGAGALHAVSTRAVLSRLPHGATNVDASAARDVARTIGTGLFVIGEATFLHNRLQITAELHDARDGAARGRRLSVEGPSDSLIGVIDRAAVALVAANGRSPRDRLASIAARTTTSLPALKLFLEAEHQMRDGHYSDALPPLQEAVRLDTGFALAFYRMSIAADWSGDELLADSAAAEAALRRNRLSTRDQWLVDAMLAWRRRDIDEADRRYRTAVLHQPMDLEAWYYLAEVYFHDNPGRGLPFTAAEAPFRRVLVMEPNNVDVLHHLIRIALWNERWHELDSLVSVFGPGNAPLRPYAALARRDTAALRAALNDLAVVDVQSLYTIATRLAVYGRDPTIGARALAGLVTADRPATERAIGFSALADISAARGRWGLARSYIDSARALVPRLALETEARLALVPFAPIDPAYVHELRHRLADWRQLPPDTSRRFAGHASQEQYAYRISDVDGHLAAIERDTEGIVRAVRAVSHAPGSTPAVTRWRAEQRAALEAELAEAHGRTPALIQAAPAPPSLDQWGGGEEARFLKARLFLAHGNAAEAARWFASFEQIDLETLAWAAPAHLFRAEALQRIGRAKEAASEYERVLELWRDCDAPLVALRELAARRAASIRAFASSR